MTREDTIRLLETEKLIVILRGLPLSSVSRTMEALYAGGVRIAEFAYDASGAVSDDETEEEIRTAVSCMGDRMCIGAGTVLRPELVGRTLRAGGSFIVSPDTNEAVIARTRELSMVSVPGAMTPTEIQRAHAAGADFVKVFPAGQLGVSYFRALRAPLSHIRMMAVAGITPENLADFSRAGACGFGISSGIVRESDAAEGRFAEITARARQYTALIHSL